MDINYGCFFKLRFIYHSIFQSLERFTITYSTPLVYHWRDQIVRRYSVKQSFGINAAAG